MSFLYPLAFLGTLAVAAPIWLHLRRRPVTNLLPFSTLRFLADQPMPRRAPLRPRDLLLLALRVAAVLLLAAAFAWPFRPEPARQPVAESRVYILDATLSRQAGAAFARDRDHLAAELSGLNREVQAAVVVLTDAPRVLVSFGEDPAAAAPRVRALAASFTRGSFLAAFRQAAFLLQHSLGGRKRIVLLSDSQANQWLETSETPPFLSGIEVELPRPGAPEAPNAWLEAPEVTRAALPPPSRVLSGPKALVAGDLAEAISAAPSGAAFKTRVTLSVRLGHGGGAAGDARLVLTLDGVRATEEAVTLVGAEGARRLQLQWEANPAEWLKGEIAIESGADALPADDRVFFSLPPVTEGEVVLLTESRYLKLALSPDVMAGRWRTRALAPGDLAGERARGTLADVLVLDGGALSAPDAAPLVEAYLAGGRGVLLFVNRLTPLGGAALRQLGFTPLAASHLASPQEVQWVAIHHPIFRPFLSPDFGNLTEVRVKRHLPLQAADAAPLLFSRAGVPLVFQSTRTGDAGTGRLTLFAFGLERDQTSWPLHQTFIPFLDLCLQDARPRDTGGTVLHPGELFVASAPAGSAPREAAVHTDAGALRTPVTAGRIQVRAPDRPGLYPVTLDEGTEPFAILAVQPPPKESVLRFAGSPGELAPWVVPGAAAGAPEPPPQEALARESALRQRLWWWLLVAALTGLVAETLWTAARMKEAT